VKVQAETTVALFERRRIRPIRPKPASNIAQLSGS